MKKITPLVVTTLLIAACGFHPLYGNVNTVAGDSSPLDNITIDQVVPADGSGVALKNALIDRFYHHGYPVNAAYALKVSIVIAGRNLVIQKDNTTTRSQLVVNATYELQDRQTRKVVDHGVIRALASYNVLQSQYTTLVTENTALQGALQELADKITDRMGVVLETGHGYVPDPTPAPKKNPNNYLQQDDQQMNGTTGEPGYIAQ